MMRATTLAAAFAVTLIVCGCTRGSDIESASGAPSASTSAAAAHASAAGGAARVDGARISSADAEPGQWLSYGRNYEEQHYSPLAQIDKGNLARLGLAWYADIPLNRGQ